jgi:hypothetical protein
MAHDGGRRAALGWRWVRTQSHKFDPGVAASESPRTVAQKAHDEGFAAGLAEGFAIAEGSAEVSCYDGWITSSPCIEWGAARKALADAIARRNGGSN